MQAHKSNSGSALKKDVEQLGKAMKDVAEDSVDYVRENAMGYYEKGHAMVQNVGETVEGKIRKNPIRSVMIAAGVGFLFGLCRK